MCSQTFLVFSRMSCIFCVKDILYFLYAIFKVRYLSSYPCSGLPFKVIRQPPALPCRLQHSTIGRLGLNHRVRDGNGCDPQAHRHRKSYRVFIFMNRLALSSSGALRLGLAKWLSANGDGEIRTLDPLLARQVLSQLSYTPKGIPAATCSSMPSPA